MSILHLSTFRTCLALFLTASTTFAGDYYVSVNGGDNLNDGLTPATAWHDISFALGNVPLTDPMGSHTIHVAPGTYSTGSGETFPLELEAIIGTGAASVEIVSEAGSQATQIVGTGTSTISIRSWREINDGPFHRSRITRVEGFHILPAVNGISVVAVGGNLSPALVDLVLEGGTGRGLSLGSVGDSFVGTSGDINDATVTDCEIFDFDGSGVDVTSFGDLLIFTSNRTFFTNTVIRDNGGHGLRLDAEDSETDAVLDGCAILNNGLSGVSLFNADFNFGDAALDATGTLIAGNGAGGCLLDGFGLGFGPIVELERCTVVDNFGPGVESFIDTADLRADTAIVYGNTVDITGQYAGKVVEFCDVGSGDPGSSMTNIALDPLFVDRANGDFRLRDNSPCIDVGNPALSPDPDGTVADMGTFPFDQDATSTYCVGKTNSLGCVPFISWTGFASTTAPQAFRLRAEDVLPNEAGLLVYGFEASNLNFHGGKLCVKAPLQRLPPVKIANPSGSLPCTGVLNRNFNQRIQSGADAMLTAGQTVNAQWRTRDPSDPAGFGDGLSNGVQFSIAP